MTETVVAGELRPLLFSIAYRMLGSVSDAEDVVQDAYLRYHQAQRDGTPIESPKAYLSTITTRLAIDHLRSARVRRERYVGPWLPEPLLTDAAADTAYDVEVNDSLSLAVLVVLESLSPVERAVFLLREVFDFSYPEIAEIVGKSVANCRQLAARARRRVEERRPRFDTSPERRQEVTERFIAAARDGAVDQFVDLLADDVVFYGDGGGNGYGLPNPVYGRDAVSRVLAGFKRMVGGKPVALRATEINGQPGVRCLDGQGRLISVFCLDIEDGIVRTVRSVINHDKLRHLGPLADLAELFGPRPRPGS